MEDFYCESFGGFCFNSMKCNSCDYNCEEVDFDNHAISEKEIVTLFHNKTEDELLKIKKSDLFLYYRIMYGRDAGKSSTKLDLIKSIKSIVRSIRRAEAFNKYL